MKRSPRAGLDGLNPPQREAVTTTSGPLLVLAGAGTGKTRVITYRVVHLLRQGVDPTRILAVTFTNKAAREMRERVTALLGKAPRGVTLSTFHSLGVRVLRAEARKIDLHPNFTIHDSSDQLSMMREILRNIRGTATSSDARATLGAISLAKNRFVLPRDFLDEAEDEQEYLVARAYVRYTEQLRAVNGVDFDDLILLPVLLFQRSQSVREKYRNRFSHVMVDEYQDTNGSQYRFTRALVGDERNICVVGDDDQSIYGFRGAELDKILRFEKDFPGARVVTLEENYRSSATILDLANAVIATNSERHAKRLRSTLGPGAPVEWIQTPDGDAEADLVVQRISELEHSGELRHDDMAVLFRSSFQARPFEEKLRLRAIPYTLIGGQSYFDRKEIRDTLAYWNVAHNPRDDVSLLRIINFPRRGFGNVTLGKLDELARSRGVSLLAALELVAGGEGDFTARVRAAAECLSELFGRARERLEAGEATAMCRELVEEVDYRLALRELYPDPLVLQARWNAVEELIQTVQEWQRSSPEESFGSFLGAMSLDSTDDRSDEKDRIRGLALMTLHSAKGLEFPAVFLVGVEEDILPHRKSVKDGDRAIEEERRLFYVGVTRARRRLILTSADTRVVHGKPMERTPSRFVTELEDDSLIVGSEYDPDTVASETHVQDVVARYRERRARGGAG